MSQLQNDYIFTSESVTEGHPDKICDAISDAILDALIEKELLLQKAGYTDDNGVPADITALRCACETLTTTGLIIVAGEVRAQGYIDVADVARGVVRDIGYNRAKFGFDADTCGVINTVHEQSCDIARGVDESYEAQHSQGCVDKYDLVGAGDQGMMFGFACNETSTFMPLPIFLAQRLSEKLTQVRKEGTLGYLRPDGKTQVSVRYVDGVPTSVNKIVVSTQHDEDVSQNDLRNGVILHVVKPILERFNIQISDDLEIYVNPTGRFVVGGPMGDSGVTGRKIICDTYGGMGRHGGGAFSGKDWTKVDRSGAYAARWVAKNVCAAGLASKCEVQLAYAIGVAHPISININTFGTETVPVQQIEEAINATFDLRPLAIVEALDLRRPIYKLTSNYGHFGRELPEFTWENASKVNELQNYR